MAQMEAAPPRYVWRRGVAYLADLVLAWLILAAFLGVIGHNSFAKLFDDNARDEASFKIGLTGALSVGGFDLPFAVTTTSCGAGSLEVASAFATGLGYDRAVSAKACILREFGVPSMGTLDLVVERVGDDGKTFQDSSALELTFESYWLKLSHLVGIVILILVCAAFGWFGGTSPGKLLVGVTFRPGAPSRPLRRELIKNAPNLVVILPLVPFNLEWVSLPALELFGVNIVGIVILVLHIAALAGLWLWPLVSQRRNFVWSPPGEIIDNPTYPSA